MSPTERVAFDIALTVASASVASAYTFDLEPVCALRAGEATIAVAVPGLCVLAICFRSFSFWASVARRTVGWWWAPIWAWAVVYTLEVSGSAVRYYLTYIGRPPC